MTGLYQIKSEKIFDFTANKNLFLIITNILNLSNASMLENNAR